MAQELVKVGAHLSTKIIYYSHSAQTLNSMWEKDNFYLLIFFTVGKNPSSSYGSGRKKDKMAGR